MESTDNSPKHLSYAGMIQPTQQQKSRRQSYAGQSSGKEQVGQLSRPQSSSGLASASMLNSLDVSQMYRMDMAHRGSRRTTRQSSEDSFTCSQQSILSAMDRFVKAVNNMDATVLVPSRLRDMDVAGVKMVRRPPPNLSHTDLYSFYNMLNDVKNELLWGPGTAAVSTIIPVSGSSTNLATPRSAKHVRQPSDDSLGSTGSTSDQDTDSDVDSVMTDRDSIEHSLHLAAAFRHHLQGLHTILHQLADSADYLSARYQEEIDASSL